jgi:hypothetical protein
VIFAQTAPVFGKLDKLARLIIPPVWGGGEKSRRWCWAGLILFLGIQPHWFGAVE